MTDLRSPRTRPDTLREAPSSSSALREGPSSSALREGPSSSARPAAAILLIGGTRAQRVAVHGTDALALVGLIAMVAFFDWVAVAVFAAVVGGLVLVRVLGVPALLQAALSLGLQAAAWASALAWYEQYWWADVLAHFTVTGLLAAAAAHPMRRAGLIPAGFGGRGRWGVWITTTCLGTTLAVLWEIAEWVGYVLVDPTIHVAPGDTVGDLTAGMLGSAIAGLLLARSRR